MAANLALAYARAGKRVIAVEVDLRGPQLGSRLGVPSSVGLGSVLAGEESLDNALRPIEPFGENLRVLPGGSPPPNPSELLGSAKMASVLEELKQDSDLVIIDTPPLLIVSDAFAVLERASGAIGVARVDVTPKNAVTRVARVVGTVNTRLLGVVATGGAPIGFGYGYGYGYGYGKTPPPTVPVTASGAASNGQASGNGQGSVDAGASSGKRRLLQRFRSR